MDVIHEVEPLLVPWEFVADEDALEFRRYDPFSGILELELNVLMHPSSPTAGDSNAVLDEHLTAVIGQYTDRKDRRILLAFRNCLALRVLPWRVAVPRSDKEYPSDYPYARVVAELRIVENGLDPSGFYRRVDSASALTDFRRWWPRLEHEIYVLVADEWVVEVVDSGWEWRVIDD